MNNEVLIHHGVKGMKWGVRRYQNADGTLTPLGKKRYVSNERKNDAYVKRAAKYAGKASRAWAKAEHYSTKRDKIEGRFSQTSISVGLSGGYENKRRKYNRKALLYDRRVEKALMKIKVSEIRNINPQTPKKVDVFLEEYGHMPYHDL